MDTHMTSTTAADPRRVSIGRSIGFFTSTDLNGRHYGLDSLYFGSAVVGGYCPALEQKLVNSKEDHNISTHNASFNSSKGMTLDY
jgi:hypothetical protein